MSATQVYDTRTAGNPQRGAQRGTRRADRTDLTGSALEQTSAIRTAQRDPAHQPALTTEQHEADRAEVAERMEAKRQAAEHRTRARYDYLEDISQVLDRVADEVLAVAEKNPAATGDEPLPVAIDWSDAVDLIAFIEGERLLNNTKVRQLVPEQAEDSDDSV